jgi:hypothetical protein
VLRIVTGTSAGTDSPSVSPAPDEADAYVRDALQRADVPIIERDVTMLAQNLHVLLRWQRLVAELAQESEPPALDFHVD